MIGMSEEEFWHSNPRKMKPHVEAFNMAKKQKAEEQNSYNYMLGRYFVDALLCTVGNMLGGKGSKKFEYPEEPYQLFKEEPKEITKEEAMEDAMSFFNALAIRSGKEKVNY